LRFVPYFFIGVVLLFIFISHVYWGFLIIGTFKFSLLQEIGRIVFGNQPNIPENHIYMLLY